MQKITKAVLFIAIVIVLSLIGLVIGYLRQPVYNAVNGQEDGTIQSFSDFVGEAFKIPCRYPEYKNCPRLKIKTNSTLTRTKSLREELQRKKSTREVRILPAQLRVSLESKRISRVSTKSLVDYVTKITYCEEAKKKSSWTISKINQQSKTAVGNFFGCYDPLGDSLKISSNVYSYNYYSAGVSPNLVGSYDLESVVIPQNACEVLADKCKTDGLPFLYEAYCDKNGNALYSPVQDCREIFGNDDYICKDGRCILPEKKQETEEQQPGNPEQPQQPEQPIVTEENKKKPDLVIDTIYTTVYGKQCINSLYFRICNNGEAAVEKEFYIDVTANTYTRQMKYSFVDYPNLQPGECTDIINPGKFNIIAFGIALQTTADATVMADSTQELEETDETNNQKTASVYAGDGYIYDPTNPKEFCDTTCYDTDAGKNYYLQGNLTFTYNGKVYTPLKNTETQDICVDEEYNNYQNENQITLKEVYCKPIIKYENTGKFSNPFGEKWVDCRSFNKEDEGIYHKCQLGACIVIPDDNLQCLDYEDGTDAFFKGKIDYTSIDGVNEIFSDYCESSEILRDVLCQDEYLRDSAYISCYDIKTAEGKGHVCDDGRCVPTDIDKESCVGSTLTEIDPYQTNSLIHTKLLGEQEQLFDSCDYFGDIVVEVYCDGKKWNKKEYSCVKDGAACVNGRCVLPDESKKKCEEIKDLGLDLYNKGGISYTTAYGEEGSDWDYCIDDDKLIEFYCEGTTNKFTDPYSCKAEGKVCVKGACKLSDPNLQKCSEDDSGKNLVVKGTIAGIDQYGDDFYVEDYCVMIGEKNDKKKETGKAEVSEVSTGDNVGGNGVNEYYCEDNILKSEQLLCAEGNFCYNGACVIPDPTLENCTDGDAGDFLESLNTGSYTEVTNQFGGDTYFYDQCITVAEDDANQQELGYQQEGDGVREYFCDGKLATFKHAACTDGKVCYLGKCTIKDPSLESCQEKPEEKGTFVAVNAFGEKEIEIAHCSYQDETVITQPYCDGNKLFVEEKKCPEGTLCSQKGWPEKCLAYDPANEKCEPVAEGKVMLTDKFGYQDFHKTHCNTESVLKVPYCDGTKAAWKKVECAAGLRCNYGTDTCEPFDAAKEKCEVFSDQITQIAMQTNGFGETEISSQHCSYDQQLQIPICDGKELDYNEKTCDAGFKCNWKTHKCEPFDATKENCEQLPDGSVQLSNGFGELYVSTQQCGYGDYAGKLRVPLCDVDQKDDCFGQLCEVDSDKLDWQTVECAVGLQCNPATDNCEQFDESKKKCEQLPLGAVQITDEFGSTKIINQRCDYSGIALSVPVCEETLNNYYTWKKVFCPVGFACDETSNSCKKADELLLSCKGQLQPDLTQKTKITQINIFGEVELMDGVLATEDICINDAEQGENPSKKQIAEFWCKNEKEYTVQVFVCPEGKICKNGACVNS